MKVTPEIIEEFSSHSKLTPKTAEWLTGINKRLIEGDCRIILKVYKKGGGVWDYVSRKTKKRVCKFEFHEHGAYLSLQGYHFADEKSIINELPDEMLNAMKYSRGCKPCFTPKLCCMNGGRYFAFTHNGEYFECCGSGFGYKLNDINEEGGNEEKFEIIEKWIEYELAWLGNGALANEELRERLARSQSKVNSAAVSIYEQTNKQQRENKPTVDGACEYFMKDKELREGAERLIKVCRELGAEIKWLSKNKFAAKHLASFRFEGMDDYNICVSLAENIYHQPENFGQKFFIMPEDFISNYLGIEKTHCKSCSKSCSVVVQLENCGKTYNLCPKFDVYINPTPKEIELIEKIIRARKADVDLKKQK